MESVELRNLPPLIEKSQSTILHSTFYILHYPFSIHTAVVPVAVDSSGFSVPTNMPPVTNLSFWGIQKATNSVFFGFAWPCGMAFTNDCIDLYGNWRISSNDWAYLAEVDIGSANSNAVVELPFSCFPTNAMEETAFFAAADQTDSDGDGLSDSDETGSISIMSMPGTYWVGLFEPRHPWDHIE